MGKGILLEVEDRFGVVLTPSGEFKRVPLPRRACTVGDEIAYQEARSPRWGWLVSAAAACLMLLSPLGYQQWSLAQPAALVMIDINPSVQLTINGREQVIAAEGLNDDGKAVLEGIDWRKRPVDQVAREITAEAVAAGKLDPGGESSTVVVAVAPVGGRPLAEEGVQEVIDLSRRAVEDEVRVQAEAMGEAPQVGVAVLEATADEVKLAHEYGLTLPKMLILEELQDEYPEVTPDQIRSVPPGQLLKSLGIKVSDVFSKAEDRHDRDDEDETAEPSTTEGRSKKSGDDGSSEPPSTEKATSPGKSGDSPGKSGDNPGKSGDNPGKSGDNPGPSDENRGKSNGSPGKSGESPGKSGMNEDRSDQEDRSDGNQYQPDDDQSQSDQSGKAKDKEKDRSDKEKDQSGKEKDQSGKDGSDKKQDQSDGEPGISGTRPGYSTIDQNPGRSGKGDVDEGEEKEGGNKSSKSKVHKQPR